MPQENELLKLALFTSASMTGTSVLTSPVVQINYLDNVGVQLHFTGTPTGTFAVQVSADHAQDASGNVTVAGNWVAISLTPSPVAAGAADDIYIDLNQLSAPWLRVQYTNASGAGTLSGWATAKSVGG